MPKEYLGDAVYVDFDGYDVTLTTEDGYSTTNRIVLEPVVYAALVAYVQRMHAQRTQELSRAQNPSQ